MAGRKKKTQTEIKEEEVKAQETIEEVKAVAQEEGVSEEIAAKRIDMEEEKRTLETIKFERMEEKGLIAPTEDEMPFADDMRTEREIAAEREAKIIADLVEILSVPKTKDSVMTFSMYTTPALNRKYFLLDVDGTAYRRGWAYYKEVKGNDPVGYIEMVMTILKLEIPRLHRAVDWAPLN